MASGKEKWGYEVPYSNVDKYRLLNGDYGDYDEVKTPPVKNFKKPKKKQKQFAITLTEKGRNKLLAVSAYEDKHPATLARDMITEAVRKLERRMLKDEYYIKE